QHKWRPKGRAVLAYGPTASVTYVWDPDGRQLDRELAAEFLVELVGETEVQLKRAEAFELFDGVPFRPDETKVSLQTEWLKWLAFEGSYKWGGAVNHDPADGDRKSTRLNSSHVSISYAVFCLKKKNNKKTTV